MKTLVRNSFLMLEEIIEEKKSKGGLLLSNNDVKEVGMTKAKVIDVGPETSGSVVVGDVAVFDGRNAEKVEIDGEIFMVIQEHWIILIQRD